MVMTIHERHAGNTVVSRVKQLPLTHVKYSKHKVCGCVCQGQFSAGSDSLSAVCWSVRAALFGCLAEKQTSLHSPSVSWRNLCWLQLPINSYLLLSSACETEITAEYQPRWLRVKSLRKNCNHDFWDSKSTASTGLSLTLRRLIVTDG